MLNRTILRIKAMQALYALKESENADYQLALDMIEEAFKPDLNLPVAQDRRKLEGGAKLARVLFEEHYRERTLSPDEEAPADVRRAVQDALTFYHAQLEKDRKRFGAEMLREADQIYDRFLLVLLLMVELADMVRREEEERQNRKLRPEPARTRTLKLHRNRVIEVLRSNSALQNEVIRRGLGWGTEQEFVRRLYNEVLKPDPVYQAYQEQADTTFTDDWNLAAHLYRDVIFKHEQSKAYFESNDLHWAENREIIRSMVSKTLRSITEEGGSKVELAPLALNWEDDREFFRGLYVVTLENDDAFERLIGPKTQNWDMERVTFTDKIILKMALSELLHFPSIPVKVTINEYIDISKTYSTPKSKQFVNGLLDALANDLAAEGLIKKSGRGLIDNR
jgi:N utilization substance protein B